MAADLQARLVGCGSWGVEAVRVEYDQELSAHKGGRVGEVVGTVEPKSEPPSGAHFLQL